LKGANREEMSKSCQLKPSERPWLATRKAMVKELRLVAENRKALDLLKKQWQQMDHDPRRRALISEKLSAKQAELKRNQTNYEKCKAIYLASKRRYHGHKNSLEEWIVGFEEAQLRLRGARDESLSGSLLSESASGLVSNVAEQVSQLETEFQTLWREKNDLGIKSTVLMGWAQKLERMQQLIFELDAFIETQALQQSPLPSATWGASFDTPPKKLPPLSASSSVAEFPATDDGTMSTVADLANATEDSAMRPEQSPEQPNTAAEAAQRVAAEEEESAGGNGNGEGGEEVMEVALFAVEADDGGDEAALPGVEGVEAGAEGGEAAEAPLAESADGGDEGNSTVEKKLEMAEGAKPPEKKTEKRTRKAKKSGLRRRLSQTESQLLMWCNVVDQVPQVVAEAVKSGHWETMRKQHQQMTPDEAAKVAQARDISVTEAARLHKYSVRLGQMQKVNTEEMVEVMANLEKRKEVVHRQKALAKGFTRRASFVPARGPSCPLHIDELLNQHALFVDPEAFQFANFISPPTEARSHPLPSTDPGSPHFFSQEREMLLGKLAKHNYIETFEVPMEVTVGGTRRLSNFGTTAPIDTGRTLKRKGKKGGEGEEEEKSEWETTELMVFDREYTVEGVLLFVKGYAHFDKAAREWGLLLYLYDSGDEAEYAPPQELYCPPTMLQMLCPCEWYKPHMVDKKCPWSGGLFLQNHWEDAFDGIMSRLRWSAGIGPSGADSFARYHLPELYHSAEVQGSTKSVYVDPALHEHNVGLHYGTSFELTHLNVKLMAALPYGLRFEAWNRYAEPMSNNRHRSSNTAPIVFPRTLPPLSLMTYTVDLACWLTLDFCELVCSVDLRHESFTRLKELRFTEGPRVGQRILRRGAAACSPLSTVTMSDELRAQAGIVATAASFAWVYPVAGHEAMSHDTKVAITTEHPHFSFLMYGGFVYLDAEGKAVQISAVELSVHGDSNSISFDAPHSLQDPAVVEVLYEQDRLQRVTSTMLTDAGCTHFAWLVPGEAIEGLGSTFKAPRNGAFLYVFAELDSNGEEKEGGLMTGKAYYFPVAAPTSFSGFLSMEELSTLFKRESVWGITDEGEGEVNAEALAQEEEARKKKKDKKRKKAQQVAAAVDAAPPASELPAVATAEAATTAATAVPVEGAVEATEGAVEATEPTTMDRASEALLEAEPLDPMEPLELMELLRELPGEKELFNLVAENLWLAETAHGPELLLKGQEATSEIVHTVLEVKVMEVKGCRRADACSLNDMYCRVVLQDEEVGVTAIVEDCMNPKWSDEVFQCCLPATTPRNELEVRVEVWEDDGEVDDLMGTVWFAGEALETAQTKPKFMALKRLNKVGSQVKSQGKTPL
jgi:hypothetical protein